MSTRLAVFVLCCSALAQAGEVRGTVVNVTGGEPLARVQVVILETGAQSISAADGSFAIPNVAPGNYTLRLNAVGFRLVSVPFSLAPSEDSKEFDVTLAPDNFRRTEKVEVKGDVFQGADSPAVIETNLTSSEIRETSTVLADDPFRSIQTLPGVAPSGNNDFFAQFSVMGAGSESTGIYIDGILVPQPFHGTNATEGATLSILTSETIEGIKLFPVAYPEKYGDTVGAALDLQTRDGSRTRPIFRVSAGLADSELLGEGQLGRQKRGSWLASARKSYLGYLLRSRLHDTFTDVSFYDGDLKLTYDLRPSQTISFYAVGGHTVADLTRPPFDLFPGNFKSGTNDFTMAHAEWRATISPHLLLNVGAAYLQSPETTWNKFHQVLENDHHAEWVGTSSFVWSWRKDDVVEGGWTARRINNTSATTYYDDHDVVVGTFVQSGTGWKNDGYLQQTSSFFGGRLHLAGGLRLDTAQRFEIHPVSPQFTASLKVAVATQLHFGVGRYNQFQIPAYPGIVINPDVCLPSYEFLQTANHYTAGIEHRFGESTRVNVTFFDRQGDASFALRRGDSCQLFPPHDFLPLQRDYSRGVQFVLQSRTANRLSGWIGYTLTYARQNFIGYQDQVPHSSPYFPTLADQRHTVNVFASYRLSPSVHVSGKWLYGSGFPIPNGNPFSFTRLPDYQRLDVRGEKDWAFQRWKLVLYGEMLNLTNHYNPRYLSQTIDPQGHISVTVEQGLPITPTAGVAFEF